MSRLGWLILGVFAGGSAFVPHARAQVADADARRIQGTWDHECRMRVLPREPDEGSILYGEKDTLAVTGDELVQTVALYEDEEACGEAPSVTLVFRTKITKVAGPITDVFAGADLDQSLLAATVTPKDEFGKDLVAAVVGAARDEAGNCLSGDKLAVGKEANVLGCRLGVWGDIPKEGVAIYDRVGVGRTLDGSDSLYLGRRRALVTTSEGAYSTPLVGINDYLGAIAAEQRPKDLMELFRRVVPPAGTPRP